MVHVLLILNVSVTHVNKLPCWKLYQSRWLKCVLSIIFCCEVGPDCGLVALSLAGCQLSDDDITPVNEAIQRGLSLHMLKLATNRLTDAGVTELVDALLTHRTHPLALIDLMNNNVRTTCGDG